MGVRLDISFGEIDEPRHRGIAFFRGGVQLRTQDPNQVVSMISGADPRPGTRAVTLDGATGQWTVWTHVSRTWLNVRLYCTHQRCVHTS